MSKSELTVSGGLPPQGDRLEGKAAIVTGAGSRGRAALGIGYATAVLFARQGARVVVADLDEDRAKATIKFIKEHGGEAFFISADITREEDCRELAEACVGRYGSLDILVNNAGGVGGGKVTDYEEALWNVALDVNLKGPVMACKYAVPHMAAGGGGSIIHISSIDGLLAGAYINVPYSVAKGGLATLTRLMAVHHGREGIRVNCLAPGHVHASFTAEFSIDERERRRKIGPLGTEGTAWDVAYAALYFASEEARCGSGIVMPDDGGLLEATPLAVMGNLAE